MLVDKFTYQRKKELENYVKSSSPGNFKSIDNNSLVLDSLNSSVSEQREAARAELERISNPDYKPVSNKIIDEDEQQKFIKSDMYLHKNLYKWLALQKININNNEVTLLGLLNNTLDAVKHGEETRDAKYPDIGDANSPRNMINFPTWWTLQGLNLILKADEKFFSGNLDKAFKQLLPETHREPEVFHDEFNRKVAGFKRT
jgi:hypothetical protein